MAATSFIWVLRTAFAAPMRTLSASGPNQKRVSEQPFLTSPSSSTRIISQQTTTQLTCLETAWVHGPLSMQAEYNFVPVDRAGGPNPYFHGGYIQTTYFLTGEHRPYLRWDGTFTRVIPRENFLWSRKDRGKTFGSGAWEIAFRFSHLDLNDAGIEGGRLNDLTVGLNWYLNPFTRVTSNYVHAILDNPQTGTSGADIFGMRIQFDY